MLGQMNKITLQTHMLYVLKGNCQSGRWKAQRPSKVVQVVSTDISCAGPSDITISAGVYSANAYCPTNTTLVGGGFKLLNGAERSPYKPYSGVQGTNSPDYSMPVNQTTWSVAAGGYPDFCFTAIALCAEQIISADNYSAHE